VSFLYNGTGGRLDNLQVERISDKTFPDERSRPLWAAEHSFDKVMRFDPLWGLVSDEYENLGYEDGFYSIRAEKFWLPASPFMTLNFESFEGNDALAAASGLLRRLGNLYSTPLGGPDYTGAHDFTMLERFQRLSGSQDRVSQIPSLILADGLAAGLVGTKTAISSRTVQWPASLAVDDTVRGTPSADVIAFKRAIRYDLRYAIPAFIVLALLVLSLLGALGILATSRSILTQLRHIYNQTSAGRLATSLILAEHADPKQRTHEWVRGDGNLPLSFGQMTEPEKDYFCVLGTGASEVIMRDQKASPRPGEDAALLTVSLTSAL
jgi:hypothetical protein